MLGPELRTYLGRELCGDVVRIIEEYVVGQSRRVAKAYKDVVKEVEWIKSEFNPDPEEQYWVVATYFVSGLDRSQFLCKKCSTINEMRVYKGLITIAAYMSDCQDGCGKWSGARYKLWWSPEALTIIDKNGKRKY